MRNLLSVIIRLHTSLILPTYPGKVPQTSPNTQKERNSQTETVGVESGVPSSRGPCGWDLFQHILRLPNRWASKTGPIILRWKAWWPMASPTNPAEQTTGFTGWSVMAYVNGSLKSLWYNKWLYLYLYHMYLYISHFFLEQITHTFASKRLIPGVNDLVGGKKTISKFVKLDCFSKDRGKHWKMFETTT